MQPISKKEKHERGLLGAVETVASVKKVQVMLTLANTKRTTTTSF